MHSFHQVVFFKDSSLYRRTGPIKVNCTTFHHFLQLNAGDQDLHWALGLCFVCGKAQHRSECCKSSRVYPGSSSASFCRIRIVSVRLSLGGSLLMLSSLELDDVRPPVKSFDPSLWDNAESPPWLVETVWRSPSPDRVVPLWRSPSPP